MVELVVQQSVLLLESLKAGTLHIVLVGGPFWDATMESVELQEVEFAWMASPRLKIPDRTLTAAELSGYPMLVHTPHGIVSRIFDAWQRKAGFKLERVITANSLAVTIHMTISGLGISALPVEYSKRHLEKGTLVRLRTNPVLPKVKYFAVHQNPTDFPLTADIIQLALDVCGRGGRRRRSADLAQHGNGQVIRALKSPGENRRQCDEASPGLSTLRLEGLPLTPSP